MVFWVDCWLVKMDCKEGGLSLSLIVLGFQMHVHNNNNKIVNKTRNGRFLSVCYAEMGSERYFV